MSNKGSTPAPNKAQTVADVTGDFNEEAINKVGDHAVKEIAHQSLTMATGIAKVILEPENDSEKMIAATLAKRNITIDDAIDLVAGGQTLLSVYQDRVDKEAAARASLTKLDAAKDHVHGQVQGCANVIRGVLGAKSSELDTFGIKMIGGRGGTRKKATAADKKKESKGGQSSNGGSNS